MRPYLWPSILLVACVSSAPVEQTTTPTETSAAPTEGAFVIYTRTQTFVLPTRPDREPQRVEGMLVQDDTPEARMRLRYLRFESAPPASMRCGCAARTDACVVDAAPLVLSASHDGPRVHVTLGDEDIRAVAARCACLATEGQGFGERADAEDGEDDWCETFEEDAALIAFLGGVLYTEVRLGTRECDAELVPDVVRFDVTELASGPSFEPTSMRCVRGALYDPHALGAARRIDCGGSEDDALCDACEAATPTVPMLARGSLHLLGTSYTDDVLATRVESVIATPSICPSVNDPCGDPAGFPIPSGAPFFVANDGSSALVRRGDRWLVLRRGEEGAAVVAPATRDEVIGVRYHVDARPLLGELATGALVTALDELPALARAPERGAACESDQDCVDRGICGGYCNSANACMGPYEGCDEAHECSEDQVCQLDRHACVSPLDLAPSEHDTLDPRDASLVRRPRADHGLEWSKRCRSHLARGALDPAYAACVRALDASPTPRIAAEVLESLAAIASRLGRHEEADVFGGYADDARLDAEEAEEAPPRPRRQR